MKRRYFVFNQFCFI